MEQVKSVESGNRSSCNTSDYEGDTEYKPSSSDQKDFEKKRLKRHHALGISDKGLDESEDSNEQSSNHASSHRRNPSQGREESRDAGSSQGTALDHKTSKGWTNIQNVWKRLCHQSKSDSQATTTGSRMTFMLKTTENSGDVARIAISDTDYEADVETVTCNSSESFVKRRNFL